MRQGGTGAAELDRTHSGPIPAQRTALWASGSTTQGALLIGWCLGCFVQPADGLLAPNTNRFYAASTTPTIPLARKNRFDTCAAPFEHLILPTPDVGRRDSTRERQLSRPGINSYNFKIGRVSCEHGRGSSSFC